MKKIYPVFEDLFVDGKENNEIIVSDNIEITISNCMREQIALSKRMEQEAIFSSQKVVLNA